MTKTRLEAFSDGVIAIIITIMVLELKTPEDTDWESIKHLLPVLGSYVLSFVFVGIYWGNHHHLLHTVKNVNGKILWANLHLLFWLSLVPFATIWMGENNFKSETVAVYGVLYLLCGFAFSILQKTIRAGQDLNEKLLQAYEKSNRKGLMSLIAYSLSVPLAFVHPAISGCIFIAVAIMWVIPDKGIEHALKD